MRNLWKIVWLAVLLVVTSTVAAHEGNTTWSLDDTDLPPAQENQGSSVLVQVIPAEGTQGATHTILVTEMTPEQAITIRIVEDATGNVVYTTDRTADANGRFQVEIFTTDDDAPGTYTVSVLDPDGTVLAETTLTLLAAEPVSGALSVTPAAAPAGTTHQIAISGVATFTDLSVVIVNAAGDIVFNTAVRSDVDGNASLEFASSASVAAGEYTVIAADAGDEVAAGTFVIEQVGEATEAPAEATLEAAQPEATEAAETGVEVTVSPPSGERGTQHTIAVTGLQPESDLVFELVLDATGDVIFSAERSADADGNFDITLVSGSNDALGTYTISILVADEVVADAPLTIIDPDAPAEATVEATVEATPEVTEAPAEATVEATVEATPEMTEAPAEATVEATVEATPEMTEAPAEATVEATLEAAQPEATEAETAVLVTVVPESGEPTTSHTISVTGLEPNAAFTLELVYEETGDIIFSTERSADADGNFAITLASGANDRLGVYLVDIIVEGEFVGEATLTIVAAAEATSEATEAAAETTPEATEAAAEATPEATEAAAETTPEATEAVATAAVTVDPASGERTTPHTITVTGLEPESTFTLELVYEATGAVLFSTERMADANGVFAITIASGDSDPFGLYLVNALVDDEIIAQATLTIIDPEATEAAQEATPEVTEAAQEATPEVTEAAQEATPEVTEAAQEATPEVTEAAQEATPESTELPDVMSEIEMTEEPDFAEDPVATVPRIELVPETIAAGEAIIVTISDLMPEERVTVTINSADATIDSRDVTADVNGNVVFRFVSDVGLAPSEYTVLVLRDEVVIAQAALSITDDAEVPDAPEADDQVPTDVTLSIVPESGPTGTEYTITVTGLAPQSAATINVLFNGEVVLPLEAVADAEGTIVRGIVSEASDPEGTYTLELVQDGVTLATVDFAIAAEPAVAEEPEEPLDSQVIPADGVTVEVDPVTGEPGTTHVVTVAGLAAGQAVVLDVLYEGESVFNTQREADPNGVVILELRSSGNDPEGTYVVVVTDAESGDELGTGAFGVGADVAVEVPETDTETREPVEGGAMTEAGTVTVTVEPATGEPGTTHVVTVAGLAAGQAVVLDVLYEGESVFNTQREADPNGVVILELRSSGNDPEGTYIVVVTDAESGDELGTGAFGVGADVALEMPDPQTPEQDTPPASGVSITVVPASGEPGTIHVVTVSGLEAEETVGIDVLFDGEVVFETERTANAAGEIELSLSADETDPTGTYVVRVLREDAVVAQGDLIVEGAGVEPGVVAVSIEPISGPVGTEHSVSISGLEAGETVTLNVTFADEVVFTTELTADENGMTGIVLTSEVTDPVGDYTVSVVRGGALVASGTFAITPEADTPPVVVEPPAAEADVRDGALTLEMPSQEFIILGEAGETLVISLESNEFDTFLRLLDDDGNELAFNDDSNQSLNSQIGPFTLPYTGSYIVVASSFSFVQAGEVVAGAFELTIERVATTTIAYGEANTATFTPSVSTQVFTLQASAGDVLALTVDSDASVDTSITITDINGAVVASDDDSGSGFDPEIPRFVVTASGTYTVALSTFVQGDEGSVTLLVKRIGTQSLDNMPRVVELNAKQTSDVLTFAGQSGDVIRLDLNVLDGAPGNLAVTISQGEQQLMSYNTAFGLPENVSLGFVVPDDGDVTILIEDFSGAASIIELGITR